MELPANDYILLSVINTALRDRYKSLGELITEEEISEEEVVGRLAAIGYKYDPAANAFK